MRVIAMIPARIGSTRLRMKNLALLAGRPVISYAIEAAQSAAVFERVVLNADHEIFRFVASRYGADFYLRPPELGSSTAKSDSVIHDFMERYPADIVAWVNPTSPLQTGEEIREAVRYFTDNALDSMVTVKNEQVHCVLGDTPLNFRTDEPFAQTQDLVPVRSFVYSVMMWRAATFQRAWAENGYALLSGKVGYFPVSKYSSIIIKTDEDLAMAEAVLGMREGFVPFEVRYDPVVEELSR